MAVVVAVVMVTVKASLIPRSMVGVTVCRHHTYLSIHIRGALLVGSMLDHRSLPPEFESRRGHICGSKTSTINYTY